MDDCNNWQGKKRGECQDDGHCKCEVRIKLCVYVCGHACMNNFSLAGCTEHAFSSYIWCSVQHHHHMAGSDGLISPNKVCSLNLRTNTIAIMCHAHHDSFVCVAVTVCRPTGWVQRVTWPRQTPPLSATLIMTHVCLAVTVCRPTGWVQRVMWLPQTPLPSASQGPPCLST